MPRRTRFEQEREDERREAERRRHERAVAERAARAAREAAASSPTRRRGPSHRETVKQRLQRLLRTEAHDWWTSDKGVAKRREHGEASKQAAMEARTKRLEEKRKDDAKKARVKEGAEEAAASGEFDPPVRGRFSYYMSL